MKKVILTCVAAMGIFMISCSSSPSDKVIKIMNDGTEQIKKADGDPAKIMEIGVDVMKQAMELEKELTDEQKKEIEEDPDVKKATEEFQKACEEAGKAMQNNLTM